jgi:hypothetical protein
MPSVVSSQPAPARSAPATSSAPSRSAPTSAAPLAVTLPRPAQVDVNAPAFWPAVLAAAASNRRVRIILVGSTCENVSRPDAKTANLRIKVHAEVLTAARGSVSELESIASAVAGLTIKIEPIADAPVQAESATPRTSINEHPLVKSAIDLFKARVLSVQPRQPAEK